ncbi:hypothetical protein PALA111701_27400 [Paenibacillus lactis]
MLLHSYVAEYLMKSNLHIQKSREITNKELNRKKSNISFSFSRQSRMNTCCVSCC